jgi:Enoyl-CoA hydratase/isomerase
MIGRVAAKRGASSVLLARQSAWAVAAVTSSPSSSSSSSLFASSSSPTAKFLTCAQTQRWQSTAVAAEERPDESSTSISSPQVTPKTFVPSAGRKYEFFQNIELTPEGVAVIRFDCPKKVNSISFALSNEAQKLWKDEIAESGNVKAVVFASAKKDMFIAGADIFDLQAVQDKQDLIGLIEDGAIFFKE